MPLFPKIDSPCPYKGDLADILDQDRMCSLCEREVHDLTDMSNPERSEFLASCTEDQVCVSYKVPAAAILAASLVIAPVTAHADDTNATPAAETSGAKIAKEDFVSGGVIVSLGPVGENGSETPTVTDVDEHTNASPIPGMNASEGDFETVTLMVGGIGLHRNSMFEDLSDPVEPVEIDRSGFAASGKNADQNTSPEGKVPPKTLWFGRNK